MKTIIHTPLGNITNKFLEQAVTTEKLLLEIYTYHDPSEVEDLLKKCEIRYANLYLVKVFIIQIEFDDLGKLKSVTDWVAWLENPSRIECSDVTYKCPACSHITHATVKPKVCEYCEFSKELVFVWEESLGKRVQEIVLMEIMTK
jgi:DNA replicative helicase MCM subunit Mcm2 (Cdc46/Mcm family)